MNMSAFGNVLDPLLRFTRNPATPNIPSVLTPPFNPSAGGASPATLGQVRAAIPQGQVNPAVVQRPVVLPTAGDIPVPAIAKGPQVSQPSPDATEARRVGAPAPHLTQSLPLPNLAAQPRPLPLEAPQGPNGEVLATRPTSQNSQLEIPKTRSKIWDTLKGIGLGAMVGAQRNPNNPWAMLGGAAAGGIGTFKAPSNADILQYEAIDKPREQQLALEQYQRDKMAGELALGREKVATEQEDRNTRKVAAETAKQREDRLTREAQARLDLQKQQLEYQKTKPIAARPIQVELPDGRIAVIDANTNKEIGTAPPKAVKPPSLADAMAELDAEEGTVDEIVDSGFSDARKASLLDRLTPRERGFVTGQMPPKIEEQDDIQYQRELAQANDKWQQLQKEERARMVQETARTRRAGAQGRVAAAKGLATNPAKVTKGQATGSTIKLTDAAELLRKLKKGQ